MNAFFFMVALAVGMSVIAAQELAPCTSEEIREVERLQDSLWNQTQTICSQFVANSTEEALNECYCLHVYPLLEVAQLPNCVWDTVSVAASAKETKELCDSIQANTSSVSNTTSNASGSQTENENSAEEDDKSAGQMAVASTLAWIVVASAFLAP